MTVIISDSEVKNIKKSVFLGIKEYIDREVDKEIKKVLSVKKKPQDENGFSYL